MSSDCGQVQRETQTRTRSDLGIYVAAGAIFLASAAATLYFCRSMAGGMSMPGGWEMSMMWMPMTGQTWADATAMFMLMWIAMMVAMMLPSAMPMILRCHRSQGPGATAVMTAGYFFMWAMAGAVIFVLGVLLAQAAMRWDPVSRAVPYLIGATIAVAGALQFSRWTTWGLSRCRGPLSCSSANMRGGLLGAWRDGLSCGVCCITCCCAPTLILLALGMMNPLVIVGVAVLIALEKLLPDPKYVVRIGGIGALALGMLMVGRILF